MGPQIFRPVDKLLVAGPSDEETQLGFALAAHESFEIREGRSAAQAQRLRSSVSFNLCARFRCSQKITQAVVSEFDRILCD
jgi:hypothetical protein